MDTKTVNMPYILNKNQAPEIELYAMECTLTARHIKRLGESESEREVEFSGYASKEVVEQFLAVLNRVVDADGFGNK